MRTLLAVVALGLVAAPGCGDDTSKTQTDMAMTVIDMTVPADMAKLTCAQILGCAFQCAGDITCAGNCVAKGSPTAQMKFGAFGGCILGVCQMDAGACTSPQCRQCLGQAGQAAATNPNAPCRTQYLDCSMN